MTQIPFPGSSGAVPTGAIQFQDDWPGLFLRGDTCAPLLPSLQALLEHLSSQSLPASCWSAQYKLAEIVEIIEREVIVRSNPAA